MGIHDKFVFWMMQCITTVTYSFLVNDEIVGCVHPQKGIRQGDPLSPYIFILCGEVLSGLCKKDQESGILAGLRVAINSLKVNHMLFADDKCFSLKQTFNAVLLYATSYIAMKQPPDR